MGGTQAFIPESTYAPEKSYGFFESNREDTIVKKIYGQTNDVRFLHGGEVLRVVCQGATEQSLRAPSARRIKGEHGDCCRVAQQHLREFIDYKTSMITD